MTMGQYLFITSFVVFIPVYLLFIGAGLTFVYRRDRRLRAAAK